MGSSVEFPGIFDLWKIIFSKTGTPTTPPRKVAFLGGIFVGSIMLLLASPSSSDGICTG